MYDRLIETPVNPITARGFNHFIADAVGVSAPVLTSGLQGEAHNAKLLANPMRLCYTSRNRFAFRNRSYTLSRLHWVLVKARCFSSRQVTYGDSNARTSDAESSRVGL
jgi:hypothetical protein